NSGGIADSGTGTVQSNNLTGIDPMFVNPAADDFRLQSGSPAINAGTSSIANGITISFDGSAPDVGALEYLSARTPPPHPINRLGGLRAVRTGSGLGLSENVYPESVCFLNSS